MYNCDKSSYGLGKNMNIITIFENGKMIEEITEWVNYFNKESHFSGRVYKNEYDCLIHMDGRNESMIMEEHFKFYKNVAIFITEDNFKIMIENNDFYS